MVIKYYDKFISTRSIRRAMGNATKIETVISLEKLAVEIALSRPNYPNDRTAWQVAKVCLACGAYNIRRITAQQYARTMEISHGYDREAQHDLDLIESRQWLRG